METTDMQAIREALEKSGVFKNADALVRFCEADEYWERLPYGKRLYFGEGPSDYLHRDVLRSVLKAILDKIDKSGEGDPDAHLSDEEYLKAKQERFAQGGLANVDPDKYMEEVRGTGMVLTDERAMEVAEALYPSNEEHRLIYQQGLRDARDNGYLAPAKAPAEVATSPQAVTVDKVIEVVRQWAGGHFHTDNNKQLYNDLRTRLGITE